MPSTVSSRDQQELPTQAALWRRQSRRFRIYAVEMATKEGAVLAADLIHRFNSSQHVNLPVRVGAQAFAHLCREGRFVSMGAKVHALAGAKVTQEQWIRARWPRTWGLLQEMRKAGTLLRFKADRKLHLNRLISAGLVRKVAEGGVRLGYRATAPDIFA